MTDLPYNPRLRDLLEAAQTLAEGFGQSAVGAEHVQLAILGDAAAIPTQVMARLKLDAPALAAELREIMGSAGYNGRK
ncbi:Clp protease N-terminal domain-containing protein [Nocardia sp. NPDC051052]|uniref:Clp protease N-terminal domain-containing protein n=1 Tax=Nocardia sp. NPDC051052 TaxID=3364322 RepID=UPI00379CA3E8